MAGDLHAGEGIVTLDGAAATVAWMHSVPGQADRYNLTVASDHTFAVGASRAVVHNDNVCSGDTILYRNIRPDENPAEGPFAKKPESEMAPSGHIMNASRPNFKGLQFISTTKSYDVALAWRGTSRTVVINASAIQGTLPDYSTPDLAQAAGLRGRPYARAVSSQEVLMDGFVPPEAIIQAIEP